MCPKRSVVCPQGTGRVSFSVMLSDKKRAVCEHRGRGPEHLT
jgi:hypothetical protein